VTHHRQRCGEADLKSLCVISNRRRKRSAHSESAAIALPADEEGRQSMAIYHLSVKPISRAGGRSATAAAAYRSGELVHDLTSDEVFDYTRKRGVEHSEIVLPTAAARADINWARDREALWNAAEIAEVRKDARVAREYEVALPHELNRGQRVELVRAFSAELANRYGVAVDFSIHLPHRSGDERNHHAHIMTTTREVTATGLGSKAAIEWSDTDRRKKGLEPAKTEVKAIRERWAALTNEHLLERGIEVRVDHRSLQEQGIDREPQSHLGPAVSGMERRGMETEVGKRISWEMQAAAQARLERAAELGKLEREHRALAKDSLILDGDIEAAKAERDRAPPALDLEQIKAQGRGVIEGWGQELAREKDIERERQRELERQREKERSQHRGRGRGRGLGPGRDGPDYDHEM
jgi:ATP-dependent exoDNAse (exonuclease V) alpha subunit